MKLIKFDLKSCNRTYACIRACPVQAIKPGDKDGYPVVNINRCIGCGSCLSICPKDAVSYADSVEETIKLLESSQKVAAIVDPSISGEFPDITEYRKFVEMIRELGFDYVNEVSFGVDLVAKKYYDLFKNFKGKYYVTANCPSVTAYIEKYYPELTVNLSPIVTPMTATAKVVRKKFGNDLKVVFIGPCVSAKHEANLFDDDGKVDSVLTFTELRSMFDKYNIKESKVEYSDFDPPIGYLGSLYPLSNGILDASGIDEKLLDSSVITAEGKDNMIDAINEFNDNTEHLKKHLNIFYNEGCLMGPGTSPKNKKKYLRRTLVIEYVQKRLKAFNKKKWDEEMNEFSDIDLSRYFKEDDQRIPEPPPERVEEVLKSMGKDIQEEGACGGCGFRNCQDFAKAVSQNITKPEICFTYSIRTKNDYIKTLKNNNQKLHKQIDEVSETNKSLNDDNKKMKVSIETNSGLLQNLPSAVVIVDRKLKVIESNQSFINIIGEDAHLINDVIPGLKGADLKTLLPYEIYNLFAFVLENDEHVLSRDVNYNERLLNVSIFSLKPNKIAGAVIRDMYVAEVRQEEITNRVSDVINENLKMVQNIAFLLGEGASKTEKMLNSIIETYKQTKKKDEEKNE